MVGHDTTLEAPGGSLVTGPACRDTIQFRRTTRGFCVLRNVGLSKITYFPLLIDRWVAGTRHMTLEQKGFYIDLLIWLYEKRGRYIKDGDHAARIVGVRPQKGRRIFGEIYPFFSKFSHGFSHSLVHSLQRNSMKVRGLQEECLPTDPVPVPDIRDLPHILSQDSRSESKEDLSSTKPKSACVDTPRIPNCPHQEIISIYHELCPMMRQVRTWTGERPKHLQARWREHPSLEWWKGYLAYCAESAFLTGKVNGFCADLEWLIRPRNFQRIHEGKYHERRPIQPTGNGTPKRERAS